MIENFESSESTESFENSDMFEGFYRFESTESTESFDWSESFESSESSLFKSRSVIYRAPLCTLTYVLRDAGQLPFGWLSALKKSLLVALQAWQMTMVFALEKTHMCTKGSTIESK